MKLPKLTETEWAAEVLRLRSALNKIVEMDPESWGKQGIWAAQKIAREALKP